MKTLTITVDDKINEGLEKIAKATAKNSSYVAVKAIETAIATYLDLNDWQEQAIKSSVERADLSDVKFTDNEEVSQWLQSWGTEFEVNPPKCK
jgi:predicted transcriptional regulator